MSRLSAIVAMLSLVLCTACANQDCSQCTPSCVNGEVTMCGVLTPPGCGAENLGTQPCSHGCSDAGPYCYQPPDAGQ